MKQPGSSRFQPLEWLDSSLERSSQAARRLPVVLYPLLASLAAMQLVDPGTMQRIASQPAGRGLLTAVGFLLLAVAALAFAHLAIRGRSGLEPEASDALLHVALAVAGLGQTVGSGWLSPPQSALLAGALGLLLAGAGLYLLAASARSRPRAQESQRSHGLCSVDGRDLRVRGGVFAVVGAFLFQTAVMANPAAHADSSGQPWELGLLAASAVALLAYALHASWQMREEERLLATGA